MLDIQGLGVSFGGIHAVQGLNMRVEDGEICGLIGPNGAGKTTVFNLVTGIYKPTAGSVRLGTRTISGLKAHEVTRAGVARTFQNIRLFRSLSVLANVLIAQHPQVPHGMPTALLRSARFYGDEASMRKEAMELLELMALAGRSEETAANLCYGDQRRLEMARALASRPRLVLLDEPAAGMNTQEGRRLMELIRFMRERFAVSIVLIEHDMKVVMGVCDRVVVLDHGVPIAEGTPEAIQRDPAVIEAYLGRREEQAPLRDRRGAPEAH